MSVDVDHGILGILVQIRYTPEIQFKAWQRLIQIVAGIPEPV